VLYLALGTALLWLLVGLGRGRVIFKRREWRLLSGAFALAAFAGAAYVGIRGAWEVSIVLVVLGLWLVTTARLTAPPAAPPRASRMSVDEARPDKGGTTGLATQLNAARDRLLKD
jgi:hypothetical protein